MYIDQQSSLEQAMQDVAHGSSFSFDLEFDNNRYSYGVTLCLIQIATPQACYVIDPMAELELSSLYNLFGDERLQKIVHSPGEDLRLLHSLGCYPKNLFDTEVIARLLNYEQTSLAVLLREKLDHHISKKHQKSNWLRRPLSEEQVQYAADDVIWLHALRDLLIEEAEAKGLMPFVQQEQEQLSHTIYQQTSKTNFLKPADLEALSPQEQQITNELLRYRDELARDINRPVYQVMSEELVRALASGSQLPEGILNEQGVHPRFRNDRFVSRLSERLRAIRAGAKELSTQREGRKKLTPGQVAAIKKGAQDREQVFAPIQQELVKRFGTYATQLILSNKMVGEILKGAVKLPELRPAYRLALIREIAAEQGIDLGDYGV